MRQRALWIILGIALVTRLGFLVAARGDVGRLFTPDSHEYDALARNLLQAGRFVRAAGAEVELFRTPGYPLFLAAVYGLSGGSLSAVLAVQVLLDVALCLLVYLLGRQLCSHRAGLLAAALQAVSTVAIVASLRVLSDGLFAFLLTADLLLLAHHLKTSRLWPLAAGAVVAAAACYVRPVGLYFGLLVPIVLACRRAQRRRALVFAAVFAAGVVPWIARNHFAADYRGFSTLPVRAAFHYQGPYVMAKAEGISVDRARQRLEDELAGYAAGAKRSRGELEARKASLGLAVLKRHPWTFLAMHGRGSLIVWVPGESQLLELAGVRVGQRGTLAVLAQQGLAAAVRHYTRGQTWVLWVLVPFSLILAAKYALALTGVWRHARLRMGAMGWLVTGTFLLLTALPGVFGHPRFRVPVMPLLNVAAAAGVFALVDRLRPGRP